LAENIWIEKRKAFSLKKTIIKNITHTIFKVDFHNGTFTHYYLNHATVVKLYCPYIQFLHNVRLSHWRIATFSAHFTVMNVPCTGSKCAHASTAFPLLLSSLSLLTITLFDRQYDFLLALHSNYSTRFSHPIARETPELL